MPAAYPDAFALKNSGLDAFLYADVGAELNGSPLTVLSVLARLDKDPWAQAAGWAALPTAAAIDGLSGSIEQMPLAPAALARRREIAARLVQLLPGKAMPVVPAKPGGMKPASARVDGLPVAILWCGLTVWMALNVLTMLHPATDAMKPAKRPVAIAGSTSAAALALPDHAAVAPPATPIDP